MRLETRLPTTVEVDCLGDFIRVVVVGINAFVSPYISSTPNPSFVSDLISTFIGSNLFSEWVLGK